MTTRHVPFLCPVCGRPAVTVVDTRAYGPRIRRRRKCPKGHRITTFEVMQAA